MNNQMGKQESVTMPPGQYRAVDILRRSAWGVRKPRWLGYCTYVIRSQGKVVYIGMSNYGPRTRLKQHRAAGRQELKALLKDPQTIVDVEYHDSRNAAAVRERELIAELSPLLNER